MAASRASSQFEAETGCTWGTAEVLVHLDEFFNLELLKKGLYRVETTVRLPQWTAEQNANYFREAPRASTRHSSSSKSSSSAARGGFTPRHEGQADPNSSRGEEAPYRRQRSRSVQAWSGAVPSGERNSSTASQGVESSLKPIAATGDASRKDAQNGSQRERTLSAEVRAPATPPSITPYPPHKAPQRSPPAKVEDSASNRSNATVKGKEDDKHVFSRRFPAAASQLGSTIAIGVDDEFYPYLGLGPSAEIRQSNTSLPAIEGTCYSSFSAPHRCMSVAPGSGLIANSDVIAPDGRIMNDGTRYRSRIVHIRYNDESFLLNEGATFRVDAPLWRLRLQPVEIVLRLLYADAEAQNVREDEAKTTTASEVRQEYLHPDGDFKIIRKSRFSLVSTRIIQVAGLASGAGSWHQAVPLLFGMNYLCSVTCVAHAALTNIKSPILTEPSGDHPCDSINLFPQQHGDILNDLHNRFVGPLFHQLVELKVIHKLAEMYRKARHMRKPNQKDLTEEVLMAIHYLFHRYPANSLSNFTHVSSSFRKDMMESIPQSWYGPSGNEVKDEALQPAFQPTCCHSPLTLHDGFGVYPSTPGRIRSFFKTLLKHFSYSTQHSTGAICRSSPFGQPHF
eukprot:gb/GECG01008748.1/.p1 GENE.gb/GECG01008748.1/~~gb/GECG01008748.1/.p1  ORF type:complete len:622 (+),score=52.23 gb/GECG01008748.1/:1-1866(+)